VGRVSVVVITRNRFHVLAHTLEQLLAPEEHPPVIVVDNASSDGTAALLGERFPGVAVVALGANAGGAARNFGVARASTPYVAFCDDDSCFAPGALALAVRLLDASPRLALIAARILVGDDRRLDPTCARMQQSPLASPPGLPGVPVLGFLACGAVVRRSAFLEVGGFAPRCGVGGEEELLAIDLAASGHRLAYVPEVVAHHRPRSAGTRPASRRAHVLRNDLLVRWLRRPLPSALAQTARILARAARDDQAREAIAALLRAGPAIARRRRPVSASLERDLRLLGREPVAT
jgi:GT2 family glycosyltransferase